MPGKIFMLRLRTLIVSLLLTIVFASVGSGLLLDKLYSQLYSNEKASLDLTQPQLELIGGQLSSILRKLENKEEFIKVWEQEKAPLALEIISRDDIGMPEELLQELETVGHITVASMTNISFYCFLNEQNKYFVLRAPLANQHKQSKWLPIIFTVIFYALLISTIFVWLFPLIRRLQNLTLSAKKLGEGELSARITPSTISYTKDIELEFNRMAQRIEELVSDISLLSSAISHEMRAPLAKLQFGLDALREEDDAKKRGVYEDRLDKVIADMTSLIETLLRYSRLDKKIINLPNDEVDLLELCTSSVASVTQDTNEISNPKNPRLEANINAIELFYMVRGDRFYLNLLVENLLANAVKYGRGKILISLLQQETTILFMVEDNGPGIDENFKQDIFKPFIRGEKIKQEPDYKQSPQTGHGLGMALVKRIADLHNVEIEIAKSDVFGGAKISLLFTQANP